MVLPVGIWDYPDVLTITGTIATSLISTSVIMDRKISLTDIRFGFFPAASVAWNIAEESIIKKNLPWLSMFKVRYSYGKVGNDVLKIGNNEFRFPYLYTIGDSKEGYQWADFNYDKAYTSKLYTVLASNDATWELLPSMTWE